ncbi:MAG: hypothetical protein U0T36_04185 [Saprospiraceae bacterium]
MAGPCLDGAVVLPTSGRLLQGRFLMPIDTSTIQHWDQTQRMAIYLVPIRLVLHISVDISGCIGGGNTCNWWGTVVAWTVPANGTISFNWATSTNDPGWDDLAIV